MSATGQLGFFRIKSESAVAAGVRRIEAVAGEAAENFVDRELDILSTVREHFKNPKDLLKSLQDLQSESGNMRRKLESMEMKQAGHLKTELLGKIIAVGKYSFLGEICDGIGPETLRKLAGELRTESPSVLLVLAVISEGKPFVVVGVGDELASGKHLDASKLIRDLVTPKIKGGGGGQKTFASAGGQDAGELQSVLTSLRGLL